MENRRGGVENHPPLPDVVKDAWARLISMWDQPVYRDPAVDAPAPAWWKCAHALLIVADEACADVGYTGAAPAGGDGRSWIHELVGHALFGMYENSSGTSHLRIRPQSTSLCLKVDRDVVCVQPKSRTPEVGCTLRTLSHNVALLPPRGVMRAHWQRPPFELLREEGTTINLLLIPLPYTVDPRRFQHQDAGNGMSDRRGGTTPVRWGWFTIKQEWLVDEVVDFILSLVEKARLECATVHGVVLPEYALDWPTYEKLAERLRSTAADVELLISGSSGNCNGERGNFALSSQFFTAQDDEGVSTRIVATTSRAKHHRWRLDKAQIGTYGLGATLPSDGMLWEKIMLPQREIHINVMRRSSTFTTMICEDLARSDPCHEVLRSIGCNLVIALLMDGPQLPTRWPARYATNLADDPGSSVLTFSSRGLISRSNTGREEMDWTVALWKDDGGKTTKVGCPPDKHGVVLMLNAERVTEMSLDGRANADAFAWRLKAEPRPIALDEDDRYLRPVMEAR